MENQQINKIVTKPAENPLKKAVYNYIRHFYPNLGTLPDVQLLAEKDYDSLIPYHTQGATYAERDNAIYFKEIATPSVICREVHHWSQYQKMGYEQFFVEIRNPTAKLVLEREAIIAATEAVYRYKRFTQSFKLFDNKVVEFFR